MAARNRESYQPKVDPRTNRTRLIAGNWKMNLNHLEAIQQVQKLNYLLRPADFGFAEIAILAPFVDLRSLQLLIESDNMAFSLGAQNCYFETKGAFTGEVSAPMLQKLGVRYVLVGHSERRTIFAEDDQMVAQKLRAVFDAQMIPILCVGESMKEKEEGSSEEVIARQVTSAIAKVPADIISRLVVAYEPIWAIGSGMPATEADAEAGASRIRSLIASAYSSDVANSVHILYGGSVTSANSRSLLDVASIDGLLVGGASLDADSFSALIRS